MITESLQNLISWIEKENFKGYDPYDTLNSWIPFNWFGKWGPVLAIQFQKRNPVNIRALLGIKKEFNPKAIGLFLQAYSILYRKTGNAGHLKRMNDLADWLYENHTQGYSGCCWGYNFSWAGTEKYLKKLVPSSVVTGFVCKGLWEYYHATQEERAREMILSASQFILKDLPTYTDESGLCISYTPVTRDVCYNASLLAGEVLSMRYYFIKDEKIKKTCIDLVNFVISRQKEDGRWNYSLDLETNREREQIDFHQGFVLESISNIADRIQEKNESWGNSVRKGLEFYRNKQFFQNGRSVWRYPREFPIDIHNQSQGIITFSRLSSFDPGYLDFAGIIASWTIKMMQSQKGYFYYRLNKRFPNRIPYIRWSQAWMLLALTFLLSGSQQPVSK